MDDCPIVYRIPHNVWELICRMLIEPEKPYWNVDSSGYYIRCLRAASKFFYSTVNQCLLQFPMVLKERSFDENEQPINSKLLEFMRAETAWKFNSVTLHFETGLTLMEYEKTIVNFLKDYSDLFQLKLFKIETVLLDDGITFEVLNSFLTSSDILEAKTVVDVRIEICDYAEATRPIIYTGENESELYIDQQSGYRVTSDEFYKSLFDGFTNLTRLHVAAIYDPFVTSNLTVCARLTSLKLTSLEQVEKIRLPNIRRLELESQDPVEDLWDYIVKVFPNLLFFGFKTGQTPDDYHMSNDTQFKLPLSCKYLQTWIGLTRFFKTCSNVKYLSLRHEFFEGSLLDWLLDFSAELEFLSVEGCGLSTPSHLFVIGVRRCIERLNGDVIKLLAKQTKLEALVMKCGDCEVNRGIITTENESRKLEALKLLHSHPIRAVFRTGLLWYAKEDFSAHQYRRIDEIAREFNLQELNWPFSMLSKEV
ncbi:uncharacterized protein LOC142342641 isoform X2 [Convolutriloba macropyga]|uniref:uncharacterized protein LOC142342641 isoform X2 n=1 Tax=Convolutriloba macropyga TaxID=536237 RepID=UPI003F526078